VGRAPGLGLFLQHLVQLDSLQHWGWVGDWVGARSSQLWVVQGQA
jgi:hypothetical protein